MDSNNCLDDDTCCDYCFEPISDHSKTELISCLQDLEVIEAQIESKRSIMEASELCVCGHEALDHHRSWFPGGGLFVEECEYFGSNIHGGAMQDEKTGRWVDHCQKFRLKEASNGTKTSSS